MKQSKYFLLKVLFSRLIETSLIVTYRLSQDHLELFFGCIRQKGGYNNNPNVVQFKSAYKKILNHLELKTNFRGNCVALEKTNVLCSGNIKDHIEAINKSSFDRHDDNDSEKAQTTQNEK